MQWTGWERLDSDIPGDQVIPFVFEGDLHVAWPVIRKINDPDVREEEQPLEISLAWTRRTAQGWTKRRVSKDPLPRLGR